jgi:hypothetical protein
VGLGLTHRGAGEELVELAGVVGQGAELALERHLEEVDVALQRLAHVEEAAVAGRGPDENQHVRDLDLEGPADVDRHVDEGAADEDAAGREGQAELLELVSVDHNVAHQDPPLHHVELEVVPREVGQPSPAELVDQALDVPLKHHDAFRTVSSLAHSPSLRHTLRRQAVKAHPPQQRAKGSIIVFHGQRSCDGSRSSPVVSTS